MNLGQRTTELEMRTYWSTQNAKMTTAWENLKVENYLQRTWGNLQMKRMEKGGPIKGPRKVFIGHNKK